jgi:FMN phosphatase YigB (HAD superfamily)
MRKLNHPCVIFDLDGTLCNVKHRQQFIATHPRNWNAWNAGILQDTVNPPVGVVFKALKKSYTKLKMVILTGRTDDYKDETELWLNRNSIEYDELYMRKSGDFRDDTEIKGEIVDIIEKKYNILCVFEDRKRVVDMWVKRGIWVFDCGQTKGDF